MARKAIPKEVAEASVPVKAAVKRSAKVKADAVPAMVKAAPAAKSAPATRQAADKPAVAGKAAAVPKSAKAVAASAPQVSDQPAKPTKAVKAVKEVKTVKAVKPAKSAKPSKTAQAAAKLERKLTAGKGKAKTAKATPASRPSTEGQDKPRLVRDSFTMPEQEYAVLAQVKLACLKAGIEVKKSELLRIGVALISQLEMATLAQVLASLPQLKTGRPRSR